MRGAFALIIYNQKLLMLLRDDNPEISSPNCWSLVGGRIEDGETSEEALIREAKEEANIEIVNPKFLFTTPDGYSDLYLVRLTEGQVKDMRLGNEGQKLEFWSLDEIGKIKLGRKMTFYYKEHYDFLKKILEK